MKNRFVSIQKHIVTKAFWIFVLFNVVQNAFADAGSSHIIKAKIIFKGKENVGYFKVWGYLYLTKDSLTYDVPKFTRQAKSWVYEDTITFYSEMFFVKDLDLTVLPVDKYIRICKNEISKIIPLSLIEHNRWVNSYTQLRSKDKEWIFGHTQSEKKMIIEGDELCTYYILYFQEPDSVTAKLVRELEFTIEKVYGSGKDNSADIDPIREQLRRYKVLILKHCSPT
jgi:hypothetical protein